MSKTETMAYYINKYKDRLPGLQAYINESSQCGLKYRLKNIKFSYRYQNTPSKKVIKTTIGNNQVT